MSYDDHYLRKNEMPKKPPSDNSKKKTTDTKETKTTNVVKKQAVDDVKKTVPEVPKRATPDALIESIINHISGVIKEVKKIDDRKFSNVTEVIEVAIKELEADGKLGRKSPQIVKTRNFLNVVTLFLKDQTEAIDLLMKKY